MRNQFLKSFSKTELADQLVKLVLQPELDTIKNVLEDATEEYADATNGERYIGKKIAATILQSLIDDIKYHKDNKPKVKDPKDQMN